MDVIIGAFLVAVIIVIPIALINSIRKSVKTGSHVQATTKKARMEYNMKLMNLNTSSPKYQEMKKRLDEEYAKPGSQKFKEIQDKERRWDNGERW